MKAKYNYIIKIDGMRCGGCEAHVNNLINKNFKVKKVKSSHIFKKTKIQSDEALDKNKIRNLIEEDGYIVLDIEEIIK